MAIFDLNPVAWGLSIGDDKIKRTEIRRGLSVLYTFQVTTLFALGRRRLLGFGATLQEIARALYVNLELNIGDGLSITVPRDLLDADALAKFQTKTEP